MGEGEGGMILEGSIEMCIFSYVKQMTGPSSMHETGCSGSMHWDSPGRGFRMGDICTPMADLCRWMAKASTVL